MPDTLEAEARKDPIQSLPNDVRSKPTEQDCFQTKQNASGKLGVTGG